MDVRQQSSLVSNHTTWELCYKDSKTPKETRLNTLAALIGSIVVWPIIFLGGIAMLSYSTFNYFNAIWNQSRIIKVLIDNKSLEEYSENRIKCCEKQIEDLKSYAKNLMERRLEKPNELGLPIPQKREFSDHFSSHLPESYWKDFPWSQFLSTDFFQKANIPKSPDRITLLQLEQVRIRINSLLNQKQVLSKSEGRNRLEQIKIIAEFSFVKNGFKRQESKEWVAHSILWLLPSGLFLDLFFNLHADRLNYEGQKHFLPDSTNLKTYADLVDAHNQLIRKHSYLVPYIKQPII